MTPGIAGRTAWTLAVQTGCDQRCSYCVVPQTRGAGRSVPVDDVLTALDRRVSGGFREIVLTGVHLGSYGRDLQPRGSLAALLRRIAAMLEGQRVRVRVSSIEPMDCGDDVIDVMTGHACFAPHFHLPLQHASARVLARMRRPYSPQAYARTVGRIRAVSPRAAIGSDVLVGFPGEREPDVELLCDYLVDSPLTHLHVFPYSERPGTEAATHGDSVPSPAVKDRAARVRQVAACLQTRFRRAQLGTSHEALTLEDGTRALTGNYCKVTIPAGRGRNQWVELRVTGDDGDLHGEVLDPGAVAPRA